MPFTRQKPDLYDYEKNTFIHRAINARWHAKVGLPFFYLPCTGYMKKTECIFFT